MSVSLSLFSLVIVCCRMNYPFWIHAYTHIYYPSEGIPGGFITAANICMYVSVKVKYNRRGKAIFSKLHTSGDIVTREIMRMYYNKLGGAFLLVKVGARDFFAPRVLYKCRSRVPLARARN